MKKGYVMISTKTKTGFANGFAAAGSFMLLAALGGCGTSGSSFGFGSGATQLTSPADPTAPPTARPTEVATGGGSGNGAVTGSGGSGAIGGGGAGGINPGGSTPQASLSSGTLSRVSEGAGASTGGLLYTVGNAMMSTGLLGEAGQQVAQIGQDLESGGLAALPIVGSALDQVVSQGDSTLSPLAGLAINSQPLVGSDPPNSAPLLGVNTLSSGTPAGQLASIGALNDSGALAAQVNGDIGGGNLPLAEAFAGLPGGLGGLGGAGDSLSGVTSALASVTAPANTSLASLTGGLVGTPTGSADLLGASGATGSLATVGMLAPGSVASVQTGPTTDNLLGGLGDVISPTSGDSLGGLVGGLTGGGLLGGN